MASLKNLDWEILKNFFVASESKNISEAANLLKLAQRTLKKQIIDLEEVLGSKVFTRRDKGYVSTTLTPQGENLKRKIFHINSILDEKKEIIEDNDLTSREEITIFTTQGLALSLMPKMIDNFLSLYPDFNITVKTSPTPKRLNRGEIQIRHNFWPQDLLKKNFLFEIKSSFYASRKYINKKGNPKRISEIKNHDIIFSMTTLDSIYGFKSEHYVSPHFLSNDFQLSLNLCKNGHGILNVPDFLAQENKLIRVLEEEKTITQEVYAGFLEEGEKESSAYKFIRAQKDLDLEKLS